MIILESCVTRMIREFLFLSSKTLPDIFDLLASSLLFISGDLDKLDAWKDIDAW